MHKAKTTHEKIKQKKNPAATLYHEFTQNLRRTTMLNRKN